VKDNFDIKGLQTSACNRAFYELYPPALKTAAAIQTLYDQGAVIVGSTKLASFAATEEPVECIDWQAPWNPQADEYQSPAGSSSGSGVAVVAYSWLDISIGSDSEKSFPFGLIHLDSLTYLQQVKVADAPAIGTDALRCAQLMDCYHMRAFYLAFLDSTFQRFLTEN
jgi:hypothetical protein